MLRHSTEYTRDYLEKKWDFVQKLDTKNYYFKENHPLAFPQDMVEVKKDIFKLVDSSIYTSKPMQHVGDNNMISVLS